MFARIEVATRPEFADPAAAVVLRKIELAHPELHRRIRWARTLDVYWVDLPIAREAMIPALGEVFLDRVLQWLFTGNLIPSAAGKHGGMLDLLEAAPHRPGRFWAVERRFRPGVTDNVGRTTLEALEIVLGRKYPEGRTASGSLFVFEGAELDEDALAVIARDVLCNELIETWTIVPDSEFRKNDRFHQERVKRDLPRVRIRESSGEVETYPLAPLDDAALERLSRDQLWALSLEEMKAIRAHFGAADTQARRKAAGLPEAPTDVELEVLAQTWSEHCKHKIFGARVHYRESGPRPLYQGLEIPGEIDGLFKATIAGTTRELPRPWLLSVFEDNAGIVAFDEETAFCIKVETHNSPSALDPYGGALTGIVGVNRDILGCGLGARPIFNTDVFCVAPLDTAGPLPERLLHPRRVLDGIRRGVEAGGNKSGIPTVNGALAFHPSYLGKPLVYCGTGGFMPRVIAGRPCEEKTVLAGDRIFMVGGRIGKDGIHGATFSSLALDEKSPVTAVQLGDPITQKRAADFLLEARDMGLYRAITDNGAGGLSSSVGEMARLSGGARLEVERAHTKYPGLKPFELVVSESQERMTIAVPPDKRSLFSALAERRGVEVADLGEFTESGVFEVLHEGKTVASLDLEFLHGGVPRLSLEAEWTSPASAHSRVDEGLPPLEEAGGRALLALLSSPNIASREWLIRQYDHEVQGTSVIKPLHTVNPGTDTAASGPNDGAVVRPRYGSDAGLAIACGLNPKLSEIDPYLMAQSAVDESVRNALCVGAEFGRLDSVVSLVDNFCWPDPVGKPEKAGWLVRACYGLREAALALEAPLVSGKDSMKNDFRGKRAGEPVVISVTPTLLVTAVARVPDVRVARTSDFKNAGDIIYLLGGASLGLRGSELAEVAAAAKLDAGAFAKAALGLPDWRLARTLYAWIGGARGKLQPKLRSLHDLSDGGLLVALAEGLIARGLGAHIELPPGLVEKQGAWATAFGEGFHSFVASVSEADSGNVEREWSEASVPFARLGTVEARDRLEVKWGRASFGVDVPRLREAWQKEGYWE